MTFTKNSPPDRVILGAILLLIALIPVASPAATITFQSSVRKTSLLELYTSEGCSSCPPAESWLSRQKDSPALWKDFVPVSFHVDYWDNLGWRDPWSAKAFTARQRAYAQVWATDTIYTPEFVLDGREWLDWSRRGDVPQSETKVGELTVSSDTPDRWQISFAPETPAGKFEAYAALLSSGVGSDVKGGENRGRHLAHDFAVVSLTHVRLVKNGGIYQAAIAVGPERKPATGQLALAVWVTHDGQTEVLQAIGGWLPPIENNAP